MFCRAILLAIGLLGPTVAAIADGTHSNSGELEFFERKIRPLLSEHCFSCHSADAKVVHGGLRLDTGDAVAIGGDSGAMVVAGKPDESLLIRAIQYDGDLQMPPKGKLSAGDIALLTQWVARGAHFPKSAKTTPRSDGKIDFATRREFWSFRNLQVQSLPQVQNSNWPQGRIDTFVLSAIERNGLSPSPPSDRATLIRRLWFDLTGVPPTPRQVRQFVDDRSPHAYRRLVDRLLASPQYGEKWARWWLDLARYTDRTASWLYQSGQSHLYRDWVVQSVNEDVPYDAFIHRQLATDLMNETDPNDRAALGFISLSPTYWKELKLPCEIINVIVADEWEERVDAVSRTFLGLTVACARCHDHKFDPISTEDYYALAGVFASCRQIERPLISDDEYEPVRLAKADVAKLESQVQELKKQKPLPNEKIDELTSDIQRLKTTTPLYDTPMAAALSEETMVVVRAGKTPQDGTRLEYRGEPRDLPAFIRGNPNRPGPIIPRRFLTVLSDHPQPFQHGSGRLELAQSITDDAASLTARVIVNRVWLEHFGQGIVATPSNFGVQGDRPSHPELLDDLAARFIAGGWSFKKLHREILLSSTWQQSSDDSPPETDPDNRLLSRMNRRRLTFEQWRDAMLVATAAADFQQGGPSLEIDLTSNHRRTLYATVHRRDMSPTFMVHDFPDPTQHSPMRSSTVTALQGLYALNGPLLADQAEKLVSRLDREVGKENSQRIDRAYRLLFSRPPTKHEKAWGLAFLQTAQHENESRWQQYAHVLLASNEFLFID
ncbi:MAG: DUF1553 domain-containing protein [Pirellulaceae bacterium]|nr:DUF1553 domain-containing protein [Pirellulaceae bacterium]